LTNVFFWFPMLAFVPAIILQPKKKFHNDLTPVRSTACQPWGTKQSEAVMANDDLPLRRILWVFGQGSSGNFSSFAGLVQVFPLDLLHGFSCSSAAFLSGPARGPSGILHCLLIGLLADRVWQGISSLLTDLTKPELEKGWMSYPPF
jgi:hypothetical protein